MIIVNLTGGLGNQMFQYAFAASLSSKFNLELKFAVDAYDKQKIHNGFELERVFGLSLEFASKEDINRVCGNIHSKYLIRRVLNKYHFAFFLPNNLVFESSRINFTQFDFLSHSDYYIHGDWQSEVFFKEYENLIRQDFMFLDGLSFENNLILNEIQKSESVSIHVRRGDYLTNKKANSLLGLCTSEYYFSAINKILEHVPDANFFVFSDDPMWAENEFKSKIENIQFISNNYGSDSYIDMRLMASCKHNIIANSTFSWWGAWLNSNPDKKIIAPIEWFTNGRDSQNLVPSSWIRL